ncbi:uncharacterized protein LOC108086492 [Drosophila ficusphila]|uniref:uncharacterized protein LOC108086492 n=1 Tax=Drosophila ficusphila TaxID=30025 RepID=UPI0007E6A5D1|nr:uncharacterized protein LOC108086492 [Drosophila ficusphila]
MDNAAVEHYKRVKAELENEKLLTFEDLCRSSDASPIVLAKSIRALVKERSQMKAKELAEVFHNMSLTEDSEDDDVEVLDLEQLVVSTRIHPLLLQLSLDSIHQTLGPK